MRVVLAIILSTSGCLASKSVECANGVICPEGSVCDTETNSCVQPQGLVVDEGIIDIDRVLCGEVASETLRLSNFGDTAITFTVRSTVDRVTVDPSEGTVPAGESLLVTATADLTATPITRELIEGAVIVTTDAQVIPRVLQLEIAGAELSIDETSYDFGSNAPNGSEETRDATLSNLGEEAVAVEVLSSNPAFAITGAETFDLDGGADQVVEVGYTPNAALGTYSADIDFAFTGPLCNEPPPSLSAQAVVSGDPILLSATQLDFTPSSCGSASATKTLTITSQIAQQVDLDFAFSGGVPNRYAPIPSMPIGAVGSIDVDVIRQAISINASPEQATTTTLTISESTGTMGISPVTIDAHHQIVASVVATDVDSIDFGQLEFGQSAQRSFEVENTGNGAAQFTISPTSIPVPGGGFIQPSSTSFMLAAGETRVIDVIAQAGTQFAIASDASFTVSAASSCGPPKIVTVQLAVVGGQMIP